MNLGERRTSALSGDLSTSLARNAFVAEFAPIAAEICRFDPDASVVMHDFNDLQKSVFLEVVVHFASVLKWGRISTETQVASAGNNGEVKDQLVERYRAKLVREGIGENLDDAQSAALLLLEAKEDHFFAHLFK